MPLNEAQTRYNLIDPAIKQRGWTDDRVKVEEPTRPNIIHDKGAVKGSRGRTDYLLRLVIKKDTQPIPIALKERYTAHSHSIN